ncbi:MAG: hypothetical protein R6W73_05005 [Candidatus Saliniplasma sp.]
MIGGTVAVVGLLLEKITLMDAGLLISITSFLVIHRHTVFTLTNLLLVLLMFLLLFTAMIVNRTSLVLARIRKETVEKDIRQNLKEFKLKSIRSIVFTFLAAFMVSIVGAMIAVYSSLGLDLRPDYAVMSILLLSGMFLVVIYLILEVVPKYSD